MKLEPYKIDFGKHSGEDALRLCFSDPAYVQYVLTCRDANGPLLALRPKLQRLITAVDALSWETACSCGTAATCCTFDVRARLPAAYCGYCNPIADRLSTGELRPSSSYREMALACRDAHLSDAEQARAVKRYASYKGLAPRGKRLTALDLARCYLKLSEVLTCRERNGNLRPQNC